jgi:hypothetical protein
VTSPRAAPSHAARVRRASVVLALASQKSFDEKRPVRLSEVEDKIAI